MCQLRQLLIFVRNARCYSVCSAGKECFRNNKIENQRILHSASSILFLDAGLFKAWLLGAKPECGEDAGLMTQHVRYYSRMRSDLSDNSVDELESTLTGPAEPAAATAEPLPAIPANQPDQ